MGIEVDLLDFLHTGDFGGIRLGMTRQQVIDLLGTPPDWFVTGRKKGFQTSPIWKYGSIEFQFEHQSGLLCMISTDHFPLEGCETLRLESWLLRQYLPYDEALKLLESVNLKYQMSTETQTGTTHLILESNVVLDFNDPSYRPPYEKGPLELTGFWLKASS